MAEVQEETVGHVADGPPYEKEAPIMQKDVVKENGELPDSASLAEIVGKEKEDPTLNSSAPEATDIPAAAANGGSAIPSEEAIDNPPAPPQESSSSEEAKEGGKTDEEATEVQPTEETAPSPGAPHAAKVPNSEETETEPPAEGIPGSGEPQVETAEREQAEEAPESTEKAHIEEIPETVGPEAQVEATPKSADTTESEPAIVAEEEPTKPVATARTRDPKTELVDTPETDQPETQVGEANAPISSETGEKDSVVAGEKETTKPEEKADEPSDVTEEAVPKTVDVTETEQPSAGEIAGEDIAKSLDITGTEEPSGADVAQEDIPKTEEPSGAEVAEENIPKTEELSGAEIAAQDDIPKTEDTAESNEPSGAECAAEETPKSVDTTEPDSVKPQITEDNTSKPSEADEPKAAEVLVDEKQQEGVESTDTEEPKAEVISKEEDSAADAGESIPTVEKEAVEPKKIEEEIPEVPTPAPSPVEQGEPEESATPKSFWGVVLKHVEPNAKSESQPNEEDSTDAPSSSAQETNNVDKSPEEAHGKESVVPLLADGAERETASGDTAASDVSKENEAGQVEVEDAPKAETESETKPNEVSPEVLEVSDGAELSEHATTETPETMEQKIVDDSSEEAGVPSSEVEEKETPPVISEVSKEIPGTAPEETVQKSAEGTAGSAEQPKEIQTTTTPEEKPESEDTTDQLTQETSKEAKPEVGASPPLKEDAVEEKPAGEDGSPLEKQPSLSVYVNKPGGAAAAAEGETPGETTPRGTPLLQRVEQLEQKLAQLENRQSPRSDFTSTGHSTPRSSIDRPIRHSTRYVLEETGSKGTLLDRVAALEQKLSYHLNLQHPPSPINDQSTPPITTVAEDSGTEPESKPAESQTREWAPSTAEKTPEQANEETSKAAQDPVKPTTEEKSPEDPSAQKEVMAPSRSTSMNEKKIKAKAAVGKITGLITGCFSPKKGKPVSASS